MCIIATEMKSKDFPAWVAKWKRPGTTVKYISGSYYLYRATSVRAPGRPWPVSVQSYVGKITENGVIESGLRIEPSLTKAAVLKQLVPSVSSHLADIILLSVNGYWYFTELTDSQKEELEALCLYKDGVLVQ